MIIRDIKSVFDNDILLLVGAKDFFDYDSNGKQGLRLGTAYKVVNLSAASIETIKVKDNAPIVTQEAIDIANANLMPIAVTFIGFSASPYSTRDSSAVKLSCSAESIQLVERNTGHERKS